MKSMLDLVMSRLKLVLSFIWVAVGLVGIVYGVRWIRWTGETIDQTIDTVHINIGSVTNLLSETMDVFETVDQSLSTAESSTIEAAIAMGGTTPMIGKTSQIVVEEIPQALDDVQASMPSVIQAVAAMEKALYLLAGIQYSIPMPLGNPIQFGLGIDYNPEIPLEQALTSLSQNLEDIPASMRAIEMDLTNTEDSLLAVSDNLLDIAKDIDRVREQIADINPELETLIASLEDLQISLGHIQSQLPAKLNAAEVILVAMLALFVLGQIPTIYEAIQRSKRQPSAPVSQ